MSDDIAAGSHERHALAQQIDRFVRGLERAKRSPNRRESFHVIEALRCLRDGQYEAGQTAIANAERVAPLPPDAAVLVENNQPVSAPQLREGLDAIMSGRA